MRRTTYKTTKQANMVS